MAVTIPCTTGAVALYQLDDDTVLAVPVEAWDGQGAAYVAGDTGLVEATTRAGFLRLEQAAVALPPSGRPPRTPERAGPRPRPQGPREREGV